ncbi:MAG: four helix bundle protein [Fidelibacterota bacterium]
MVTDWPLTWPFCSNTAEAYRKRRYEAAFVSKLSDAESEAAETQLWVEFSLKCGHISKELATDIYGKYDNIIGKLVTMINHPEKWTPG